MKINRFMLIVVVLLFASLACSLGGPSEADVESGGVLFQDDFSDTGSGWDRVEDSNGMTDYQDGSYRIFTNVAQYDRWANPGKSFTDVSITVEATKVGGVDDNDFGVICRYRDVDNFYYFLISSDGYYAILKIVSGQQELLSGDSFLSSDAIRQGSTTNTIRADCVGTALTLTVNGTQLATVQDSSLTSGDVGLIAGTFDTPGTDILFDNFVVRKP